MLNIKKFKTIVTLGILAFAPLSSMAQNYVRPIASGVPDGSYNGRFKSGEHGTVHLIANHIEGCDTCFLATIFVHHRPLFGESEDVVRVYKAIPKDTSVAVSVVQTLVPVRYTLTPLDVDAEGEIIQSKNPSLIMQIDSGQGTNDVHFSNVQANSENPDQFGRSMVFKDQDARNSEDSAEAGTLFPEMSCRTFGKIGLISTSIEDGSRFGSVTDLHGNGLFNVEEKAPGVFTYQRDNALSTGDVVSDYPDKLIIFIKRGARSRALMVSPKNPADVRELILK